MLRVSGCLGVLTIILNLVASSAEAENTKTPSGLALVIGQAEIITSSGPQAEYDAGLIAATLAKKGFHVMAARNLDSVLIKSAIGDFLSAAKADPTLPILIYLGGQVIQSSDQNYLLASDFKGDTSADLKTSSLMVSTLMTEVAQISSGPKLIILDGARLPYTGNSVAGRSVGLALLKAPANIAIILNQSPGMFAKDHDKTYQAFALALSDAIQRSSTPRNVADFVILRTFELSKGTQIPWAAIQSDKGGALFTLGTNSGDPFKDLHTKPKSTLDATQAFAAAMLKGSVISYEEYNLIHIQNPMTKISQAVLAALRDSQIWQEVNSTPSAFGYWGYLKMYPNGIHANEARQALMELGKSPSPPQGEPLQIFSTSPPSHDERAVLSTISPYRLDEASSDLGAVATRIATLLPAMTEADRTPLKPMPPSSRYGLPMPALDRDIADNIKLPPSVPDLPIVASSSDPVSTKKASKPSIPLPPNRQTNAVNAPAQEDPELMTTTTPAIASGSSSVDTSTPDETGQMTKPATQSGDVFEESFGSTTGQQNLPY